MELKTIACRSCGAPLQIPNGASSVTCKHCSATMAAVVDQSSPSNFERQAEEAAPGLITEFIDFLKTSKKWWLTPIIVVLLLIGVLIILSSTAAAPFIYTLF